MPFLTHSGFNGAEVDNPERFDLLTAINHAENNSIKGCQLYLNDAFLNTNYRAKLLERINESKLEYVVFHLPNLEHAKLNEFVEKH